MCQIEQKVTTGLANGIEHPTSKPSAYQVQYDPALTLRHPDFRILESDDPALESKQLNLACAYNEKHEVKMMVKPIPVARENEVVVRVRATGICGSDVHFWKHGQIGPTMIVRDTCGAGHESAGEVVEVGPAVTQWSVGDRVAIECGIPCGEAVCDMCRVGRYNACPRVVFFSTPPYHGTLTRYHAHPAAWLHRLPDNLSFEEGSLCEPLAVALAGIERAGIRLGDPILICGAGPIGLVSLLAARAAGCTPIVITDLQPGRLEFARSLVPSVQTCLVQREWSALETAEHIKSLAGVPLHCVLECSGFESSITTAIYSVKFGGKVFVIGAGPSQQSVRQQPVGKRSRTMLIPQYPFGYCSANEIDLQFQYRYANQYPKALRLVAGGLINLKPLVTHRFSLSQAIDAFNVTADPTRNAIKVQIQDLD